MTIFFTGCTHFGHAAIINLANRPFVNVDDMDETLVENWNKSVGKNDQVFHLGDFAYKTTAQEEFLRRLNGKITLLRGNHDPADWGAGIADMQVADKGQSRRIVLCHYPIEEWNGWWQGALHLHCHTHQPHFASADRRFNVTVEACNYRPVALEDILTHQNAVFIPPDQRKS